MTIDVTQDTEPLNRYFQEGISSGWAYLTLREDYREHLRLVQKEIGFKRLRFHGILCDQIGICKLDGGGRSVTNYQNAEKVYDFMLDMGIKPFVEFSFMPRALASQRCSCRHVAGLVAAHASWGQR